MSSNIIITNERVDEQTCYERQRDKLSGSVCRVIGYWLLGKIVERTTGQSYQDYVRANILKPLWLSAYEMDFVIHDSARHANGYLPKYSLMNLVKGFIIALKFLGEYESKWLRLKRRHLNGPVFGGLVGTARGFSRFLQD